MYPNASGAFRKERPRQRYARSSQRRRSDHLDRCYNLVSTYLDVLLLLLHVAISLLVIVMAVNLMQRNPMHIIKMRSMSACLEFCYLHQVPSGESCTSMCCHSPKCIEIYLERAQNTPRERPSQIISCCEVSA